jgi:major vault protein
MLEIISLSTSEHGKAKNFREPLRTPYLRVKNNRVSDVVKVQTADLVDVTIEVSYRVNFEGDKNKWFNVENYVGLLCERCRSILRGVAKRMSIRDFMADSVTVVRDALLGEKPVVEVGGEENEPGQPVLGARPGLTFDENDMHLYDIEVLDTRIGDGSIAEEITRAQHAIVTNEIGLDQDRQSLALTLARQEIQQKVDAAIAQTQMAKIGKDREVAAAVAAKDAEEAAHSIEHQKRQLELTTAKEDVVDASAARELERAKTKDDHRLEFDRSRAAIERETEASHTEAFKTRVESISPGLIAALQVHGDKVLTAEMIKELGAVAAMTGDSVEGVFKKIMQGSVLADVFTGDGGAAKGIAANALRRSGLRSEIEK